MLSCGLEIAQKVERDLNQSFSGSVQPVSRRPLEKSLVFKMSWIFSCHERRRLIFSIPIPITLLFEHEDDSKFLGRRSVEVVPASYVHFSHPGDNNRPARARIGAGIGRTGSVIVIILIIALLITGLRTAFWLEVVE
jgi:hypothetical protein